MLDLNLLESNDPNGQHLEVGDVEEHHSHVLFFQSLMPLPALIVPQRHESYYPGCIVELRNLN